MSFSNLISTFNLAVMITQIKQTEKVRISFILFYINFTLGEHSFTSTQLGIYPSRS